jgi:UTP--glucose-1-phosphate uridylyltransferase
VLVKSITKAVIPAAGFGTRFLPITKSMPKEMIPVVHKPVIHYVVEEAYRSGIREILIITGKGKRAIEDYFDLDNSPFDNKYLHDLHEMLSELNIYYVRQKGVRGLGDAIGHAEAFAGDDSFAVLLGDTITIPPCTQALIRIFEKYQSSIIAVEKVPQEMLGNYGIIATNDDITKDAFTIFDLIEKPVPEKAPSDLAILGSYILTPGIFECIRETTPDKKGEVQLTDALKLLTKKEKVYGHIYTGRRYDIGNKLDWLKSNIELSLQDPEMGEELHQFIRGLLP